VANGGAKEEGEKGGWGSWEWEVLSVAWAKRGVGREKVARLGRKSKKESKTQPTNPRLKASSNAFKEALGGGKERSLIHIWADLLMRGDSNTLRVRNLDKSVKTKVRNISKRDKNSCILRGRKKKKQEGMPSKYGQQDLK